MIRIYQHKTGKIVKAIQFYVNYSEVERFTGQEVTPHPKHGYETLGGQRIEQGNFIVKRDNNIEVWSKEKFRSEYEPE